MIHVKITPADLTQEQIEEASRNLDDMLRTIADKSVDHGERMRVLSVLAALPERDKGQIPPLVRMLLEPPKVVMNAVCEMRHPDGRIVESDHASL